jgi:hypothetical protein
MSVITGFGLINPKGKDDTSTSHIMSRDRSVAIATGYGVENPAFYPMGTEDCLPEGKVAGA